MKSRIKKRAFGIATLALVLILALTAALYSAAFFSPATYATTYHSVSISGANNVDVYISGDGVTQDDNGNYQIPHGADVEITVVNDNSVSTGLDIDITGGTVETGSTSNFAKVTSVTKNFSITVTTQEGFATEPGSSLSTAYEINDGDDLISLSKILAARTDGSDITATTAATFAGYLADFGLDEEKWYTTDTASGETVFNATEDNIAAVKTVLLAAQTKLSTSYFSLSDDVMINDSTSAEDATDYSHGYFGLGSRRGVPFSGVFDFNGHSATLHLSIAEAKNNNFNPTEPATEGGETDNVLSIGFFNYIYGDGSNACAILGADVRGTIAVSADVPSSSDYLVYIGGVAGSIGDKVVLSNVKSSVSVSAQTGFSGTNSGISVYAGGVFGFSGADVDAWSNVSYDGIYSEISVVCAGADTDERVIVGAFAGVIQNAYVRNFSANLRGANILADASDNGSAIAGGLAGAVYSATNRYGELDSVGDYTIGGININAAGSTVSASVAAKEQNSNLDADDIYDANNNEANFSVAISGGLFGVAHSDSNSGGSLTIGDLDFTSQSSDGVFSVEAYTSDSSSYGIPFAGGVIGYVVDSDNDSITFSPDTGSSSGDGGVFIFESYVVVTSTQNGNGPVYAGGVFGYNAFNISGVKDAPAQFKLNDGAHSVTVVAEQSQSSGSDSTSTLYDVSAGLVTSKLPAGYSFSYVDFTAHGSTVTARRETGSSAVGDISAGSIAGKAVGDSSSFISNVKVTLNNCSINALGNSLQSQYSNNEGNNVYAGGFIGYVSDYGSYTDEDNVTYGLSNITLNISVRNEDAYAVRGVQNANCEGFSGDYKSECFTGGMFGMVECCAATELNIVGTTTYKPLIYSYGSNNPRTASTGGLIGALRDSSTEGYSLENSSVTNIHVVGRAYIESQQNMVNDIYVGGAVGVAGGTKDNAVSNISGITVEDTAIESVGESAMLTYAGGIFGGVWWTADIPTSNLISRNNTVFASSASYSTYAGGISGMIQNNQNYNITNISSAKVLNTSVEAVTYGSGSSGSVTIKAYAAGICPRICQYAHIENSVSNAVVSASGNTTVLAGIGIFSMGEGFDIANDNSRNNYFVAANVQESSMAEAYAFRYTQNPQNADNNIYNVSGQNNYAVALTGGGQNRVRINDDGDSIAVNRYLIGTSEGQNTVDGIYANIGLQNLSVSPDGKTATGTDTAGNNITVRVVGDSVTLSIDSSQLRATATNTTGTSYVQILIGDDMFCSYAIIVEESSVLSGDISITDADDGTAVGESNSHNYSTGVIGTETDSGFDDNLENGQELSTDYEIENTNNVLTILADSSNTVTYKRENVGSDTKHVFFNSAITVSNNKVSRAVKIDTSSLTGDVQIVVEAAQNADTGGAEIKLVEHNDSYNQGDYRDDDSKTGQINGNDYILGGNTEKKSFIFEISETGIYYLFGRSVWRLYSIRVSDQGGTNYYVDFTGEDGVSVIVTEANYTYFQIYAGQNHEVVSGDTTQTFVQSVNITTEEIYSPSIYLVTDTDYLLGYEGTTSLETVAKNLIENRGSTTNTTAVNNYFKVTLSSHGKTVNVSPVLGNSTGAAFLLRYTTDDGPHYIIIEVVPNALEGITVTPSEDTPPYATHEVEVEGGKETHHIYSAGDTVLLESDVDYRFDYNRFIVDVEYELGVVYDENGNQSDSLRNFITVQPNGTVLIDDNVPSGTRFTVICRDINNGDISGTITLEVRTDIDVESRDLTGANYAPVADNHAIIGESFSFTVSPRPGYGLNPEVTLNLVEYTYNDQTGTRGEYTFGTITLTFNEERANVTNGIPANVIFSSNIDVPEGVTLSEDDITYNYDAQTGKYTITLGADVTQIVGLNKIYIDVEFEKVYTIMFDLGTWADDDGGLRYYTYTVKNGTDINSKLYNSIVKTIATENEGSENRINERAGFTFKGFYLTSIASSESAYQQSFEDRFNVETATEQVRGSINYYARWNYTVVLNAPESVGIESGLASSLLEKELYDYGAENQDEATSPNNIIPIDTMHGFSFSLTGNYVGTPRVEVYTAAVVNNVNVLNALAFTESGGVYTISNPDAITGTIYIYVYPDNIAVGVGETDTGSSFSTAIDLREDGIFTVRYVINHGAGDTTLGNSAVFKFSKNLPEDTRIRLFYQQDSTPKAVGEYVVGENGVRSVKASAFGALPGSGTIPDGKVAGVGSETYYLVITLPNNDGNNFDNADGAVELTVRVAAQGIAGLTQNSYETKAHVIPDENRNTDEAKSKIQDATLGESQNKILSATVNMYGAIIRKGSLSDGILSFDSSDTANGEEGAPADVRHRSKFYVWRIAIGDWGTDVNISDTQSGSVVTTDNYVYVLADNELTVSGTYTVELMEVTNTQYPAAGVVIWSYTGVTSGN